jgi:membrane-associated phospholipid phosphatase
VLAQTDPPAAPTIVNEDDSPRPVVSSIPSLGNLFGDVIGDFKRFPSRSNLTWLGVGALGAVAGRAADGSVTRTFSGSSDLRGTFAPGAVIGGTPFQLGAAFSTYVVGRATNSPRAALVGADLFRAQVLAQGTTYALKYSIRRIRPDDSSFSFPSGHTAVSFASATVLQRHFGWKIGVPAYALASYVGASRIQTKRHYLSDVAFGAALGIVAGRSVTVGRGDGRFAVAPMAAPGGGGVGFTWVGKQKGTIGRY